MAAVASGLGGLLGERVKVLDGDALVAAPHLWFNPSGGEVFDFADGAGDDGHNAHRYGALYFAATGRRLLGDHRAVRFGPPPKK